MYVARKGCREEERVGCRFEFARSQVSVNVLSCGRKGWCVTSVVGDRRQGSAAMKGKKHRAEEN